MHSVIVTDDEPTIRRGIIELIDWKNEGCFVIAECSNGQEVLDFIRDNQVDIVITDIKMPLLDGLGLAKEIQKRYPGIAVVILTAYSDFNYAKEAIRYGVSDFVIKNCFIDELPKVLKKITNQLQSRIDTAFTKKKDRASTKISSNF